MRTLAEGLRALLADPARSAKATRADLYTIETRTLGVFTFTNAAANLAGFTSATITRDMLRSATGFELDGFNVTFRGPVMLGGVSMRQAMLDGSLDGAKVTLEHAVMPTPGDLSLGTVVLYVGVVGRCYPQSISARMEVLPMTHLLNIELPSGHFEPTCRWVFGDAHCGVPPSGRTCDRTPAQCTNDFGNYRRFGGFPFVPQVVATR